MKILKISLIFTLLIQFPVFSQTIPCPFVNAGPDQTADCSSAQGCSNLIATFLDIRETTSYGVESIPHNPPIPYNQAGGTGVSVNIDDVWSDVVNLSKWNLIDTRDIFNYRLRFESTIC